LGKIKGQLTWLGIAAEEYRVQRQKSLRLTRNKPFRSKSENDDEKHEKRMALLQDPIAEHPKPLKLRENVIK
jgi:hypothetical protein